MRERPFGILCVTGDPNHQENYAVAFAADPRARIIAVSDEREVDARRRELNQRLAARLRVPYIADLDEALARSEVDACCICAPPERRGRIAIRCAKAGKHLYLTSRWSRRLKMPTLWLQPCAQQACAATCSA